MLFLQVQLPSKKAVVRVYADKSFVSTSVFLPFRLLSEFLDSALDTFNNNKSRL